MSPATVERTEAFMQSARYFCPTVTKSEVSLHIFIKVLNIKFHRNSSSGSRADMWTSVLRTRRSSQALFATMRTRTGAFRNYANALKNV